MSVYHIIRGMRVGFVGLGEMGLPMAGGLAAAGHDVVGFDVDAGAVERAAALGVDGAATSADAADAGVVLLMVRTLPQVEDALFGDGGMLSRDRERVVVVMSTIDPAGMERVAERAAALGATVLDAPVSGGVRGAEARTLSIMAAGDRAAFDAVRPLLDELGSTVRYLGARPGLGQAAKLANQLMMTVALAGTVEGLALAERYGLERDQVLDVVGAGTGSSWVLQHWDWMRSLWEGYEPGNALDVLLKDMRALFAETEARGHASPVAEAAYERLLAHWQPYMS